METKRRIILKSVIVFGLLVFAATVGFDFISQPSTLSFLLGIAILIPTSWFTGTGIYDLVQDITSLIQTNNNQTKENENA
jgi:hypothetical protein